MPPSCTGRRWWRIDKLDKIGADGVATDWWRAGVEPAAAASASIVLRGMSDERRRRGCWRGCEAATPGGPARRRSTTLGTIWSRWPEATPARRQHRVDPSLARGLSYYTGAIMEIAVPDLAGSLGGGGRYDNLVGMFLGRDVPACGFSLGLERIIVVMTERKMFPAKVSRGAVDVMVAVLERRNLRRRADAGRGAARGKLRVDVYPGRRQARQAAEVRVEPHVPFAGDRRRGRARARRSRGQGSADRRAGDGTRGEPACVRQVCASESEPVTA